MNRMADNIGPFLTREAIAERRGITNEQVDALTSARDLIALTTADSVTVYPAFQLTGGEVNTTAVQGWRIWDHLGFPWAGALWLLTPNEHLDDIRPIDWTGDPDDVIQAAVYDTPDDACTDPEEMLADPNSMEQVRESSTEPPAELTRDDFLRYPGGSES